MDENIKRNWEEKIRSTYGDSAQLLKFMTETMDNFAYRYISTSLHEAPRVNASGENLLAVTTLEESMVNALKITHPVGKEGIKELARTIPKAQRPTVQYSLTCQIHTLKPDNGKLVLKSRVNWNFPTHAHDQALQVEQMKTFVWDDLQVFRKGFPLAVQEVCDLFL